MRETLERSGGVGLAAPQVGFARRVCLVQLQRPGKPVLLCVDPAFSWRSASQVDGYEACLSVQGVGGLVRRSQAVDVVYYDVRGRRQRLRSTGWEARIFQHEMDHLDGVLYTDRLVGPLLPLDEVRRRRKGQRRSSRRSAGWQVVALQRREGPWVLTRVLIGGLMGLWLAAAPAQARRKVAPRRPAPRCDSSRYGCVGRSPQYFDKLVRVIYRPRKGYDRGCLKRLRRAGIRFRLLGNVKGVQTPVEVRSKRIGGVLYRKTWNNKRRFILDCHMVEVLAVLGREIRRAGVASIYYSSTWRYTYVHGTHRLSKHASGRAIDITAIDGNFGYASVVRHYEKGVWGCGRRNKTPRGRPSVACCASSKRGAPSSTSSRRTTTATTGITTTWSFPTRASGSPHAHPGGASGSSSTSRGPRLPRARYPVNPARRSQACSSTATGWLP